MLDIAYKYANTWRYVYNVNKSEILIYGFNPRSISGLNFNWYLGNNTVPVVTNHTHLGIQQNMYNCYNERARKCCDKGRKAYFAFANIGTNSVNPLTLTKLYKSVVLPSVLYGCELWNSLNQTDFRILQSFEFISALHS